MAQDRRMQFDLNGLAYQAFNSAGAPSAFGGTTHTGSIQFTEQIPPSVLLAIKMRTGGAGNPFINQSFTGGLSDLAFNINLVGGNVTGGTVLMDVNGGPGGGGDRYTASILAGGSVQPFVGGGFTIDSLTASGHFSDNNFAGVPIADFFAAQNTPGFLTGDFLAFSINPSPSGSGNADIDLFVNNVPAPAGLGLLGGVTLLAVRRRRRA
jgi:hypothetical protein